MAQYIDKNALVAKIERRKNYNHERAYLDRSSSMAGREEEDKDILSIIDSLNVKETETPVIPKHSYFEHMYHCGSEPMWKIGDILAVYEFYSDREGEHIYGEITDVKMDKENEDWLYTFNNGDMEYESMLISQETYKKN